MAHDHSHDDVKAYYVEQLCTIGIAGALGGIAVMLWYRNLLWFLAPKVQPWVLAGGIALLVLVAIRAAAVWFQAGRTAPASPDHDHDHDHAHGGDCGHDHDHDHATTAKPAHDHDHDHSHDHDHVTGGATGTSTARHPGATSSCCCRSPCISSTCRTKAWPAKASTRIAGTRSAERG